MTLILLVTLTVPTSCRSSPVFVVPKSIYTQAPLTWMKFWDPADYKHDSKCDSPRSILLWLYSPLLCLGRFFSFLIYIQSVRLLERGISQGRFLEFISIRGWPQGRSAAGRIRSIEKYNELVGNRNRDSLLYIYIYIYIYIHTHTCRGTQKRSWLWHYATSRKVAGSIPDQVMVFFSWPNPSSPSVALGSTQPLTEMNTRNLPMDKGRQASKADNFIVNCEPII
jgi:hypothetical protein